MKIGRDRSSAQLHPFELVLADIASEPVALDDIEREAEWVAAVAETTKVELTAHRRRLLPERPKPKKQAPMPAELRGLGRAALLERLAASADIRRLSIAAHLNLDESGLTDDDLRRVLAEFERCERTLEEDGEL